MLSKRPNYTDDSWAAFSEALSNAGTVLGSETSSDEEIQTAYNNLQKAAGALETKPSSGNEGSGSSDNSNSIISVNGNSAKPVILSKETYGNTVVGNNLTGEGLTAANITSLYEINDDGFKGNVANLSAVEKNADGTESTYNYVYVKCDSCDTSKTIKINVSAFKDNAPAYVYKTDELGNITLVKAVDAAALAVNKDYVEISPEVGAKYIVTDKKLAEKNRAQNTASNATKKGWNKNGSSWTFVKNGQIVKGWGKDTDGKWYYLKDDGSMAAGTTVNGYKVGNDGAWIK